jgi:hypothetical protein
MSEEIAKDRTENRTVSKTRQFYGFMNAIKYDEDLVAELRHDYEESGLITDPLEERIAIDPEIDHGKPVIKGTRVPVDIILGSLAGGMETREVANEYLGHAPKIRFFQRDHKSLKEEEHNYYQHDGRHNG